MGPTSVVPPPVSTVFLTSGKKDELWFHCIIKQGPWNKHIYNCRYSVIALQTTMFLLQREDATVLRTTAEPTSTTADSKKEFNF